MHLQDQHHNFLRNQSPVSLDFVSDGAFLYLQLNIALVVDEGELESNRFGVRHLQVLDADLHN